MPLLASVTTRWSWRSDAVTAERLRQFALAEHNTFVELTQAAEATEDPERAAAYLRHAVDEARHARAFLAKSRQLGGQVPWARADSVGLYDDLGERRFVAFVAQGEARAVQQFGAYVRWFSSRDPKMAALFAGILVDERRHATYAAELQQALGTTATDRTRVTAGALWEAWMRVGRTTSRGLFAVSIWALTPLLWGLGLYTRWVRPAPSGI